MSKPDSLPFLWGAQYYRAPTPEPACWEHDLKRMKQMGFNSIKYWVQWRWAHRGEDLFYFDDLDRLMDLAGNNGLGVTLNLILDVAPVWLYEKHPDAKQIMRNGQIVQPYANACRQIGGTPGPCYNHPGALADRQKFVAAAIEHFRNHPAMAMWDVWNEPEQSFPSRTPAPDTMVCYCDHCRKQFIHWLQKKYASVEDLAHRWGRPYAKWSDVELPHSRSVLGDFVDWREFHLDTMTTEANWRLDYVRKYDPAHVRYLHVVPNTMEVFNSVTCVDDFDLAENCQVFAATMNGGPTWTHQVLSAARGRVCYNVESHINAGSTGMHQRMLDMQNLLRDFLPQIGLGIKGFLFWQYRPEVLGVESPAWGLVHLDGSDRPITEHARKFRQTIDPYLDELMACPPSPVEIGIWKSRKNEIFHYGVHGKLQSIVESIDGYLQALYWNSFPFRFISGQMLEAKQLDGLKLLIMPACYYLTRREAEVIDQWVRDGGVLINEAHLGGYDADANRHSRIIPGHGLAERWGIREIDTTSSHHLKLAAREEFTGEVPEDVKKALKDFKTTGGQHFPIQLASGNLIWGASRYAVLQADSATLEATFDGQSPCIISKTIGKGRVFYCGTNLGQGAAGKSNAGLLELFAKAATAAGVAPTLDVRCAANTMHLDVLRRGNEPRFIALIHRTADEQELSMALPGSWRGLFTGRRLAAQSIVSPNFVDLFVRDD